MCKASITARHTTDAHEGETYGIGISDHGFGALVPQGSTVESCVACLKDGAQLTLSNIPNNLQKSFEISDIATATFVEHGNDHHDQLRFENGQIARFSEFGDTGVSAYVGTIDAAGAITAAASKQDEASDRELESA